MTEYNDVPTANALYMERQNVENAISLLDGGGNMSTFMISQAPPPPGGGVTNAIPSSNIYIPPPTPQEVVDIIRAWLVQRQADLEAQLAAIGVTNPPARRV